jgi:hypothetical protein
MEGQMLMPPNKLNGSATAGMPKNGSPYFEKSSFTAGMSAKNEKMISALPEGPSHRRKALRVLPDLATVPDDFFGLAGAADDWNLKVGMNADTLFRIQRQILQIHQMSWVRRFRWDAKRSKM